MDDSKFAKPTGLTGDWVTSSEIWFWHGEAPDSVKHAIEKMTGHLLDRAVDDAGLVYCGGTVSAPEPRALRLRLEAVVGIRKLYSLTVTSTSPRNWDSEEKHLKAHNRTVAFWGGKLQLAQESDKASGSPAAFDELRRSAIAREAAATPVEDPAPINQIHEEILASLRAGKEFRTAHHEGGTRIFFDGKQYVRDDYGEYPDKKSFDGEGMLVALRGFYDWESRRETHPHKPPELDVWKYIQVQLRA